MQSRTSLLVNYLHFLWCYTSNLVLFLESFLGIVKVVLIVDLIRMVIVIHVAKTQINPQI